LLLDLAQVAGIIAIFEYEGHIQKKMRFDLPLELRPTFLLMSRLALRPLPSLCYFIVALLLPVERERSSSWVSWLRSAFGIGGVAA
jgi:hypothetical protein